MNIRRLLAPNPGPFTLDGTQTYLIGATAVLDPGPDIASHIEAIREAQPALTTILITHRHGDHAPAAVPLKAATGARVCPRGWRSSRRAVFRRRGAPGRRRPCWGRH